MAERGPVITEAEFKELLYEMCGHSATARKICDRWWSEELARSREIEDAAAAKATAQAEADAPPPSPGIIFGADQNQNTTQAATDYQLPS